MSFLPILSAALFVSLLPNEMGITVREHVGIGVLPVVDLLSVLVKIQ